MNIQNMEAQRENQQIGAVFGALSTMAGLATAHLTQTEGFLKMKAQDIDRETEYWGYGFIVGWL
jgi:hypothetical protein